MQLCSNLEISKVEAYLRYRGTIRFSFIGHIHRDNGTIGFPLRDCILITLRNTTSFHFIFPYPNITPKYYSSFHFLFHYPYRTPIYYCSFHLLLNYPPVTPMYLPDLQVSSRRPPKARPRSPKPAAVLEFRVKTLGLRV